MIKNDQDYIQEWLDHHRSIGFDHFYVYDNESTPAYKNLGNDVTITYWDENYYFEPQLPNSTSPFYNPVLDNIRTLYLTNTHHPDFPDKDSKQYKAYQHCLNNYGPLHKWIAFIDSDEFIMLAEGENLKLLLREFSFTSQLLINWRVFSSSGHLTKQESQLKSYTQWFPDYQVKPIVQPPRIYAALDAHILVPFPQFPPVNENKENINYKTTHSSNRIWINHYWSRSKQDFEEVKKVRRGGITLSRDANYYDRKFKFIEQRASYHMKKLINEIN